MKRNHTKLTFQFALLLLTLFLCSCVTPDPRFVENSSKIQDVNYPASKIVGTWASFYISLVQAQNLDSEGKVYYDFRPNGRGLMRQASKNASTGDSLTLEGDFTWKYLGNNRWLINMPPSSEYRVTSTNNMVIGNRPAVTFYARYYDNELYVTTDNVASGGSVWVKADRQHLGEVAARVRNAPSFHIGNRQ